MEWDGQSFASGTLWYDHNLSHGAVGWDGQGVASGTLWYDPSPSKTAQFGIPDVRTIGHLLAILDMCVQMGHSTLLCMTTYMPAAYSK